MISLEEELRKKAIEDLNKLAVGAMLDITDAATRASAAVREGREGEAIVESERMRNSLDTLNKILDAEMKLKGNPRPLKGGAPREALPW